MTTKNLIVLAKIVTAVESGGQVYGRGSYDDVTMPYKNSAAEHTVTLGAGQFYGAEARALINMIFTVYPDVFRSLDTADPSIESMIPVDWVAKRWKPNDSQVRALRAIISCTEGKACQDTLLAEQMAQYVKECSQLYPATDYKAQMMFAEIRHLGGLNVAKRIFNRCASYTLDGIMASLKKDQGDQSSDNQAGDEKYWSRHEKCREFIEKYAVEENDSAALPNDDKTEEKSSGEKKITPVESVLSIASAEVGYLEKRTAASKYLDNKTANAGSGNYTKYWRDIKPGYQGAQWCAGFVSWVLWRAFGKELAKKLLSGVWVFTYCPDLGDAGAKRLYSKPNPGDIILFWKNRGSEGGWRFGHTGIVESVTSTTVTTIEGNTSGGSTVVANGGGVFRKTYKLSNLHSKTRYYRPDYAGIVGSSVIAQNDTAALSGDSGSGQTSGSGFPFIGKVTADQLNVRTGPGTNYKTSAYYPLLKKGDKVEVISKKGNWYLIKIKNQTVLKRKKTSDTIYDYVYANYITRA